MNLVFIYGPPGVGKLTVAQELARATGYGVFHNHVSIDCVLPVFEFGTKPFFRAINKIRSVVFKEAAREGVSLIFTYVYAFPEDTPYVESVCETVEGFGGRVCLVHLVCDKNVLERRVSHSEREALGKLHAPDKLREVAERYDIFSPVPGRESLEIDNTNLLPAEAARQIVEHFRLPTA